MRPVEALLPALLCGAALLVAAAVPRTVQLRVRSWTPGGHSDAGARAATVLLAGSSSVLALAGALIGLVLGGPALAVLGSAGVLGARRVYLQCGRSRLHAGERARAVEACGALAGELRAGRPPAEALAVAAELATGASGAALASAAATARLGGDVPGALLLAAGGPSAVPEVLRGLAACWRVCSRTGAGLATAVERLAAGVRARQEQDLVVDAALSGPRATAALLAGLPLAGIALAAGLGARPLQVLLHTPPGVLCLAAGSALDALGLWWMSRLVARARGAR